MTSIELLEDLFNDIEFITRLDFVDPILRGEARNHLNEIYHKQNKNFKKIKKELKALEILKKAFDIGVGEIRKGDFVSYRLVTHKSGKYLSPEEYDLFNEVLKDEE